MNSREKPIAVVLVSGGLDSAVALAWALREGFAVAALTIDYGQRHRGEIACAARVAASLGAPERLRRVVRVDLRAVGGSALTDRLDVPKGRDERAMREGVPITYVPARNMTFLSVAVGLAEALHGVPTEPPESPARPPADEPAPFARDLHVVIGVNAVDYSGYPDCREEFIRAFESAATLGTRAADEGRRVRVHTPLVAMSKAQIIAMGARLGVDFSLTRSCYDPAGEGEDAPSCGMCDACEIRRRGFAEAGVADPTRYAEAGAPMSAAQAR